MLETFEPANAGWHDSLGSKFEPQASWSSLVINHSSSGEIVSHQLLEVYGLGLSH
jgi:hypothetical protein